MLYALVKNWKETPGMEEERMFDKLKESVKKERMEIALNRKKENASSSEIAKAVQREEIVTLERRQPLEDDTTNVKIKLVVEENDSYVWKMTEKTTLKTSTHTSDDRAHQVALCSTSTKTTEGLPVRQFEPKKAVDVTPARVSGQLVNVFITKPQQVYTSVGIRDQNTPQ